MHYRHSVEVLERSGFRMRIKVVDFRTPEMPGIACRSPVMILALS